MDEMTQGWTGAARTEAKGKDLTAEQRYSAVGAQIRADLGREPRWAENYPQAYPQQLQARRASMQTVETGPGEYVSPWQLTQYTTMQGRYWRPGGGGDVYDDEGLAYSREPLRALNISTLSTIPGVVQAGGITNFGAASSKVAKQIQLSAQEKVGILGQQEVESSIIAQGAAAPETGYRMTTLFGFGVPNLAGQGYRARGITPVGKTVQSVPIRAEDVSRLELGTAGMVARQGYPAPAYSIAGTPQTFAPPKNWNEAALRQIGLRTEGEKSYVDMEWQLQGGGMSVKWGGVKSQVPEADIGRMFPGSNAQFVVSDVKNWRMMAGMTLGALGTPELQQRAQRAGVPLRVEQGGGVRWGPENDPAMAAIFKGYAEENLKPQPWQKTVARGNLFPFALGSALGKLPGQIRSKIPGFIERAAIPGVTGITPTGRGMYEVSGTGWGLEVPALIQARREWEFGRTRFNPEEMAQMWEQNPQTARRMERYGQVAREPYAQAIRHARYATGDIASPGATRDIGSLNWAAVQEEAMLHTGASTLQDVPQATLAEIAGKKWASMGTGITTSTSAGEKLMMSPSAMRRLGTTQSSTIGAGFSQQETSAFGVAYQQALGAAINMQGAPSSEAERIFLERHGKYAEELQTFASHGGVQQRAVGTQLQQATEGSYIGSLALGPGEMAMGRERLNRMWPELRSDETHQQFQDMLSTRAMLGTGHRRPISDVGQFGGIFGLVGEQQYRERGGELALTGNELAVSPLDAAVNRGDFDADRYLAVMGASVRFGEKGPRWTNPEELRGQLGNWDPVAKQYKQAPTIAPTLMQRALESNRVRTLLGGFESVLPGAMRDRMQAFTASRAYAPVLRELQGAGFTEGEAKQHIGRGLGITRWLGAGDEGSNEIAKWIQDIRKYSTKEQIMAGIGESFGHALGDDEIREGTARGVQSKAYMGITYDLLNRSIAPGMRTERGKRGLAEGIQKALDVGEYSLGMRSWLSFRQTYGATGKVDEATGQAKMPGGWHPTYLTPEEIEAQGLTKGGFVGGPTGAAAHIGRWFGGMTEFSEATRAEMLTTTKAGAKRVEEALKTGGNVSEAAGKQFFGSTVWKDIAEFGVRRRAGKMGPNEVLREQGERELEQGEARKALKPFIKSGGQSPSELVEAGVTAMQRTGMAPGLTRVLGDAISQLGGPSQLATQAVSMENVGAPTPQAAASGGGGQVPPQPPVATAAMPAHPTGGSWGSRGYSGLLSGGLPGYQAISGPGRITPGLTEDQIFGPSGSNAAAVAGNETAFQQAQAQIATGGQAGTPGQAVPPLQTRGRPQPPMQMAGGVPHMTMPMPTAGGESVSGKFWATPTSVGARISEGPPDLPEGTKRVLEQTDRLFEALNKELEPTVKRLEEFKEQITAGTKLSKEQQQQLSMDLGAWGRQGPLSEHISGYWDRTAKRFERPLEGEPTYKGIVDQRYALENMNEEAKLAQLTTKAWGPAGVGGGGRGQQARTAAEQMFGEFTFGGAYFKLAGVKHILGQPVNQWMSQAQGLGAAQVQFGTAMGAPAESIMQTPMGQIQAWEAQKRSWEQGMGVGSMEARAGLANMMGVSPDYQSGLGLGRAVGPAMTGAQWGLGAGIVASTIGKVAGAAAAAQNLGGAVGAGGLIGTGGAIGAAAGTIGLGVGIPVAAGLYLGEAYQQAAPEELYRQAMTGKQPSFMQRLGLGVRSLSRAAEDEGFYAEPASRALGVAARAVAGREAFTQELEAGAENYIRTGQFRIENAAIHIQDMKIEGLDPAQKFQAAGALGLMGYTEEDFISGRALPQMQRLAPMAMGGTLEPTMGAAMSVGRALGIAPGAGLAPYFKGMPLTQGGQTRQQMAAQMLGGIGGQTGVRIGPSVVQQYAEQLDQGVPLWQLQLQAQQQYGALPIAGAMGYTPGTPSAMVVGGATSPTSQAQAQAQAQIAQQYGTMGELLGLPPEVRAQYAEQLEQERAGQWHTVRTGEDRWERRYRRGIDPEEQMRREQNRVGIGAEAFGFMPGTQDAYMMTGLAPTDLQGYTQWQTAMQRAAPTYQALGGGPQQAWQLTQQFQQMQEAGVTPQAQQLWGQSDQGQGAIAGAMGMPSGWGAGAETTARRMLETGAISAQQYGQMASMTQFSTTALGYSMMAGGWGGGEAMLGMRQALGLPGLVEGAQPLYEQGAGGGIYPIGQRQQMQMARQQMQQSQAYQMGTGEWATQGGFQMGMLGDIQQQQMHLATFQQTRGLQSQLFEANAGQQKSNLAYAMASATMQYQQSMESLGLQQSMWSAQTGFQRQEFGFQYQQQQQQRQWGREDFAFNKQVAGLQYSWQQEDLDRGIRFATGREKEQLIRQRGRGEEMYTIQEGQRGKQEGRQEEVWKWEEERFARQRQQFEEIKGLEAEQFSMRKRHLTESYNLQMAHLQEQMDHLGEVTDIQRKINELQNDQQENDMKYRLAEAERQAIYYEKVVFPFQEKELALQQKIQEAQAKYLEQQIKDMSDGGRLWRAWDNLLEWFQRELLSILAGSSSGGSSGSGAPDEKNCPLCGTTVAADYIGPCPGYKPDGTKCPHKFGSGGLSSGLGGGGSRGSTPTFEDALTGRIQREGSSISIGNISINIPPGNYGSPEDVAKAVSAEFESKMNSLAARQRQRGEPW